MLQFPVQAIPGNTTIGTAILKSHGLDFDGSFFWIAVGALLGFTILFDLAFVFAMSYFTGKLYSFILTSGKTLIL